MSLKCPSVKFALNWTMWEPLAYFAYADREYVIKNFGEKLIFEL